MNEITEKETAVLRRMLGLHANNRTNPTRNWLFLSDANNDLVQIDLLMGRGFIKTGFTFGPKGKRFFYEATEAGKAAVLEQPWSSV